MSYLKLVLIRHAESLGNTQKRMEGQSSTPLTERGIRQAKQLAQSIVLSGACAPIDWPTHLYTSPLLRAKQTARYLAESLQRENHPFQTIVDSQLQEIHQGIFQGLTWVEAQAQFPDLCTQLMSSLEWQPVPEAESPGAARARSHAWLQSILSAHQPEDTLWIVSHTGIMLHLIAEIMHCDRTWKINIEHTATFEFWLSHPSIAPAGSRFPTASSPERSNLERSNPERWILNRFNQILPNTSARGTLAP